MQLAIVDPFDRSFLPQLFAVVGEFGSVIPWLDGSTELVWATNGAYVLERLAEMTGQGHPKDIVPYQFRAEDAGATYIGGLLQFARSPERLRDSRNAAIAEGLADQGAAYISCLQVRPPRRDQHVSHHLFPRAIEAIMRTHPRVWGVVSEPRLVPWYQRCGATLLSPRENRDGFWIVSWSRRDS